MANASNISQSSPLRRWVRPKAVLATALLAELLAWWLLRGDLWRTLGLGWQFWLLVAAGACIVTLAVSAGIWFVRRRLQFGLRTLLVLVLLVGTTLGLIGMHLQTTEKQRRAAAALDKIGAGVSYAGENQPGLLTFAGREYFQQPIAVGFQGPLREEDLANIEVLSGLEFLSLSNSQLSDADMAHFSSLRRLCTFHLVRSRATGSGLRHLKAANLRSLDLCWSPIDDDGLKYVGQLSTLTVVNLNRTRITDAGLAHLATLDELSSLYLDITKVTGEGFVHLRQLRHLQQISLTWTGIGNAELVHLRELPELNSLNLSNTSIDDGGVETLCGMSGLQTLRLHGTDITEQGIHQLQQALPNCQIQH